MRTRRDELTLGQAVLIGISAGVGVSILAILIGAAFA